MLKKHIPNILTSMNLSFGVLSIMLLIHKNYLMSALFILAAALVDRYDGKVARMLNVSSEIGMELDSLSDLVSFGVAPAMLIFLQYGLDNSRLGIPVMLFYIICGCYRLAKYNISTFDGVFSGIPITIAGCFLAILSLVNVKISTIAVVLMIILGYLMVSNFKLKKI